MRNVLPSVIVVSAILMTTATAHAEPPGKPIAYMWPGFAKMSEANQDWYVRSYEKRRDLGNNTCLMKNLDEPHVITDLRGKCFYSQAEIDALNAGE